LNLSPHLTLYDFVWSGVAQQLGINNNLPPVLLDAAKRTAAMFECICPELSTQAGYGVQVFLSSAYRSPALNAAIGSRPSSEHTKALALDFTAPSFGSPLVVCRALLPFHARLGVGRITPEYSWVHVSSRAPANPVNRVWTLAGKIMCQGLLRLKVVNPCGVVQ
jgi:hypothetical protein